MDKPESAFHRKTWEVICDVFSDLKGRKILVPSSGDNRAVFAFAALGAEVVSCDICEKQLEYAKEIAENCHSGLQIMRLEEMHDEKDRGHFWFYEKDREKMSPEEIDAYYDLEKNPLSGLPQWFTVCCRK